MINCFNRNCPGKIKFKKPVPKGKKPEGNCTICSNTYIAAYDCNQKLKIIQTN